MKGALELFKSNLWNDELLNESMLLSIISECITSVEVSIDLID